MGVTVRCDNPQCGEVLQVPDELRGKSGRCPACGHEFRVSGAIQAGQIVDAQKFCHLQVESGPDLVGQMIQLEPQKLYEFGKSDSCTYQLPGESVSRHHCLVQWINDQWTISDLNSTNGTFLNGVRIGRSILRDNDEVAIGKYRLRFVTPRAKSIAPRDESEAHGGLPVVQPVEKELSEEPELSIAASDSGSGESAPWTDALRRVQSGRGSKGLRLPGIDDSAARIKSQESEVRAHHTRFLLSRLAILVLVLAAAGGISKGVWWYFGWKPDRATEMPLPEETHTLIVSLIEQEHYHEARQEINKALGAGISKADLDPLRSRLSILVHEERQEREAQAKREREAQAERERQAREQLQRQLAQLGKQMDDALAKQNWQRANELFGQATDLASSIRNQPEWQTRWGTLRRGPIKVLLTSSRAKLMETDFEGAAADAKAAASFDPDDPEARDWLGELLRRVGAGLLVESNASDAVVTVDGKEVGPVGKVFWKLSEGDTNVVINADQYMPHEQAVSLMLGELCKISVSLQAGTKCGLCRGKGYGACRKCGGSGKGICSKCGGSGKVACPDCKGKWKETCKKCRGSGRIDVKKRCRNCGGTGRVSTGARERRLQGRHSRTCRTCGGSGSVTRKQSCSWCKTKGYILACHKCNRGKVRCSVCGGTRRHGPCQKCEGTGRIGCPRCSGVGKVPATQPADGS